MKCNDNYGNHECWVMKTIAAKREHYFPLFWTFVFHVIFPISQAHKMKGSQIKCTVFLGQFYVRSFQKRMQGICLLVRTYRKFFFFFFYGTFCSLTLIPTAYMAFMGKRTWMVFQKCRVAHSCFSKLGEKKNSERGWEGKREREREYEIFLFMSICLSLKVRMETIKVLYLNQAI